MGAVILYVDGMWFRHTGIGRIYENLLRGLLASGEVERVCTVVPSHREEAFRAAFDDPRVDARFLPLPYDLRELWRKAPAVRSFRPRPHVFYYPSFNVPFFPPGPTVATVCDLIPLSPHYDLPPLAAFRFRRAVTRALRLSRRVVCISEATRRHVMEETGDDGSRLEVIHPPLDFPAPPAPGEFAPPAAGDYLLYVGNRHVHKNLRCLLSAFRLLAADFPALSVVVAGTRMREEDDVDRLRRDPALAGRLVEVDAPSDREVAALYAGARLFVFPSLIEGFGIPPLEALHLGAPVVCADTAVCREVCGDAARYADPRDPADFARAVREALSEPRDRGRAAGAARARLFAADRGVARYLDLFRRVAAEGGRR